MHPQHRRRFGTFIHVNGTRHEYTLVAHSEQFIAMLGILIKSAD
jgi:hypothetical protein